MISETDIGDYEIIKGGVLGTGAFATVWKGRSKKAPSTLVAIKAIKKKNFLKSQQLLSKEITILKELSSLHHKNVVGLLDCVELKDDVCLVMEYCNGGDLADCLHRNGTLSEDTLCSYVKQIAEAMKALQQKGIVHRDLKPQNILLCYEGIKYPHPSEMLLKIADFGFARFIIGAEMATTLCGSPMYMAPEVIMSVKYSAKADLWSIGTILYQCLTGRAPFQAQNPQELKKKYEKSPGLKPNIPASTSPELRDLLMRMLKRDAEERISFEEFFKHSFLQLPGPVKVMSSPVAVPKRRSSSTSESGNPGKSPNKSSPSRNRKSSSPSHSPKKSSPSHSPKKSSSSRTPKEAQEEDMVTTLTEAAGLPVVDKKDTKGKSGRSISEDYVMVPETLCFEGSDGEASICVKKAPLAVEEISSFSLSTQTSPRYAHTQSNRKSDYTEVNVSRPLTLSMETAHQQSKPVSVSSGLKSSLVYSNSEGKLKIKSPDVKMESDYRSDNVASLGSKVVMSEVDITDVGSISPPAVQFCAVASPSLSSGLSWKRSNITLPASVLSSSPHQKSSVVPPHFSPLQLSNTSLSSVLDYHPPSLPTLLGSPDLVSVQSPQNNSPEVLNTPFAVDAAAVYQPAYHTSNTVPDNMIVMAQQREGLLAGNTETKYRISAVDDVHIGRFGPTDQDCCSPSFQRENTGADLPPPNHMLLNHSPPLNTQCSTSPMRFPQQHLSEDTLMDDNHNETLGKLSFVLDLVECILDLARSLGSAFRSVDPVEAKKVEHLSPEYYSQYRTSQRSLEQLVLYARACSLLNSALHLARDETRSDRLQQSTVLCNVISELQTYYHHVVNKCKTIHRDFTHNCKTPLSSKMVMATADKLIYNQAVHMCQSAALDEFSSNCTPEARSEVIRRYQVAQIFFHSLAQTAHNENDKYILMKYLKNVECRLCFLASVGNNHFGRYEQQCVDNQKYQCQS